MIYFLLGKDFNIINKRINEIINKYLINNIIKYDYTDTTLDSIINEVNYIDLFNEKKLIIVSYFSLKDLNKNEEEILSKYINNMNDNVIIFKCIDESLDERKSLTKLIKQKCKVEIIEKLNYKTLHEYISNMFKENGINASFNQIKKILDLCEYNSDYTINEVEKLLLYKNGETELFDKDIDDVISKNNEKEMFNLIDGIMNKDVASSLKSFKILTSGNVDSIVIIDNIEKQIRSLLQIKYLLNNKESELQISRKLGINPYIVSKYRMYINNFNDEELLSILYKLSDIDINVKINGFDSLRLLESFLISL